MAFLESPRFPEKISFHATGGPGWITEIVAVESGVEFRNQILSQELGRWSIGHDARLLEDVPRTLQAFFRLVRGRTHGFRFKDWTDYQASASQGVVTTLSALHFQLWKRYTLGSNSYDRKIQKPVSGKITLQGTNTTPVIDYTTGIVTVASGSVTGWSGEFDVPVRFDSDAMGLEVIDRNRADYIVGWANISLVEIRI